MPTLFEDHGCSWRNRIEHDTWLDVLGWADGTCHMAEERATIIAISNFTLDATPPPGVSGNNGGSNGAMKEPVSLNSMASQNILTREDSRRQTERA